MLERSTRLCLELFYRVENVVVVVVHDRTEVFRKRSRDNERTCTLMHATAPAESDCSFAFTDVLLKVWEVLQLACRTFKVDFESGRPAFQQAR